MFDVGTLRITNPKTLQRWIDLGWYENKVNGGLIFNPYCGRFSIEECVCTKCRNKKENKEELITLVEQFKKK